MNRHIQEQLRVLLADDDSDVRAAFRELLGLEGFKVFEADSGLAALEILQRENVTFSIMDVDMPGMNGIEVLKVVRQQLGAMPCIFVTGDSSRARQVQALEVGAFSMLAKPVAPDLLRFSVKRLIDHHYGRSRGQRP